MHIIARMVGALALACAVVMPLTTSAQEITSGEAGPAAGASTSFADTPRAYIVTNDRGWRGMTADDFTDANCGPDTWKWEGDVIHCTGKPKGVIRSKKAYTNFEVAVEWRHLKSAGNSGVFVWANEKSVEELKPNDLPEGIEVQILDHGYKQAYESKSGKKATWFTTHGDVFPTRGAKMTPFAPVSPDGSRGFPSKYLAKGSPEWNHYYIRCLNGEVRLWVNGEEVSGGENCQPRSGYLCLESEGSPIDFRNLRIRELP